MLQFIVDNKFEGYRLDKYLRDQNHEYLFSRTLIEKLISENKISVNSGTTPKKSYILKNNDVINVVVENLILRNLPLPEKENIPLNIVYEDEYLAIVNKPAGLTVHPAPGNPTGTLVNALLHYFDKNLSFSNDDDPEFRLRPGIVHRLDKDTSGVLIVAKDNKTHFELSKLFTERKVLKTYYSICLGVPEMSSGTISHPIGRSKSDRKMMRIDQNGKNALTHYAVLREYEYFSVLKVEIETGRTHQIRVHLDSINHPVLGDIVYNTLNKTLNRVPHKEQDGLKQFLTKNLKRQALHAWQLNFIHPITNKEINVIADIPIDLLETEKYLNEKYGG